MRLNMPMKFPGTPEEAKANRRTHHFDLEEGRCWDCDCRRSGRMADWPCGEFVPRVEVQQDGTEQPV